MGRCRVVGERLRDACNGKPNGASEGGPDGRYRGRGERRFLDRVQC